MQRDHRPTPILTRYLKLWALVLAAVAYAAIFHYTLTLTGSVRMDGVVGVMLGLYVSSHPTANFLDLLLFSGRSAPKFASLWSALLWFAFNALVMAAGWFDIFVGAVKLAATGP